MSYASEVLADSPLAYWRLGESSGTTLADSSGNSRTASLTSGTLGAAGAIADGNTALTNPVASVASAAWMNVTSAITVEAWAKAPAAAGTANGEALVSRYGTGAFYWLLWRNGSNRWAAQVNIDGTLRDVAATVAVANATWYHVVFTFDGATLRLYVDGTQVASASRPGSLATGTRNLSIGRYSDAAVTSFLGTVDEVAVYPTALSAARIADHYAAASMSGLSGSLSAALPVVSGSLAGSYAAPVWAGTVAVGLPSLAFSVAGDASAPPSGDVSGSLAAVLPSVAPLFSSGEYVLSSGDVSDARHRGGVGYATWLPAVAPMPTRLVSAQSARDVAFAFGDVTIVGTQPTFTTTTASEPRHRDRIIVGGRDVTYFRGAEARVGNYQLMEPFGYGTATLEFPQVYPEYEAIGEGDLSWLAPQSKVLIQRVDQAGNVVATDYKGFLIAPNANTGTFTYEVGGEVTGPAALRWRPMPLFRTVEDIGRQMARALGFVGARTPRLGAETGIEIARVGGMTLLEYMQQLVGRAWTRDGNQWTVMPDDQGVYRTARKDRTTVAGTVYLSTSSAEADLRRDISEEPNRIFATGVTPAGKRVRFGRYPGLDISGNPPSFPGNLTAGDTGDGVLALIRQLQVQGYLNAETAPGQYDADVTKAIREVQDDADLTVTGNVNAATWDAIFDNTSQGVSLKLARIEPAAQKRYTKQYRYSASGAIKGRNPFYDPTRLKIDRSIDFGTGFTQAQMREWSKAELVEASDPNWVGTLTIHSGAIVAGDHTPGDPISSILPARDIKPGMNLSLPQFQGGIVVHVTAAQVSGDVVTLQVDTRARDAWNVAQVIERNRESRRDPARAFFRELASSKAQKDAIEEWSEVGGLIPDQTLTEGWNVLEVVAGQAGTVRSIRFETNPNAESSVAVFGQRVWPKALQRLIGNPLSEEGSERWADETVRRKLERDHGLLYAAGDATDPGGYSPGHKSGTSSIFTGRFEDDASFAYYTDTRPILYVAVYVDRDCTIPGGRIMWPQLESGA